MAPRKAVLVGCALSFGIGALFVAVFGYPLYDWYLTGKIEVDSVTGAVTLGYVTFRGAPIAFAFQFARGAAFSALGFFLLAVSVLVPILHWKRLFQSN